MAEEEKKEEQKEEEKKEVKPEAEEQKEEVKEEPKEEKKEEAKPEEKKEAPVQVKEEKKEEKPAPPKKKEEEKVEVPKKFKKLVEEIEKMSVLDLAELVKILEKKFGVSTAVPIAAAPAAPGAAPAGAPVEEKAVFNIELTDVGSKKIEVIKVVRDVTQKGLKDSKDLVDAVASGPQMVKENVKKEEAGEIKKKFEEAGAKVELK